jgi:polar amino acid transport system substrate-binding protein
MRRRAALLLVPALLVAGPTGAQAPADAVAELAPHGTLRAAINLGNPVLARRDPATGALVGVSVDLARALGRRLGVPVALVPYDGAGFVSDAAARDDWDVCFLAVDPVRARTIAFTAPYLVIEGTYLVREDSAWRTIGEADRDGMRIAVGRGSAYDLFLTRALHRAELVRAPTSAAAMALFAERRLDAAAGVAQPLRAYAAAHPGFRVIPGRFMAIEQAMGTKPGREAGLRALRAFVEAAKADGVVAAALRDHGEDATVADPDPRAP